MTRQGERKEGPHSEWGMCAEGTKNGDSTGKHSRAF